MISSVLWLSVLAAISSPLHFPVANITSGTIRGRELISYGGHKGIVFAGIPLAKPPIGSLRFKSPVPPDNFTGILDAFEYGYSCICDASITHQGSKNISEDCLQINVFTTDLCLRQGGCAVLAMIHGGFMITGTPIVFPMDIIINNFANEERNVIVVTLPYRTGILGLFNIAPGLNISIDTNIPYRDLIFGLQWIQREIENFGGNPNKVTAFGHSAGASIVQKLAISPKSKGLFNQIVSMSGPSDGSELTTKTNSFFSQKVATLLGCATPDETFQNTEVVEQILDCVRAKNSSELLSAQKEMDNYVENYYGPWIDGDIFPGMHREMTSDFIKDKRSLKVLIGTVTGENRRSRNAADGNGRAIRSRLDDICTSLAYYRNYENPEGFRNSCLEVYGKVNKTQMLDDHITFYVHSSDIASVISTHGTSFVYSYNYKNAGAAFARLHEDEAVFRPNHAEDYIYVFGLNRGNFTARDYEIERIYSGIVANFVNYGNPSFGEKWNEWDPKRRNYFSIDFDENFTMPGNMENYYSEAEWFWNNCSISEGGNWRQQSDFPDRTDTYVQLTLMDGLTFKWTGKNSAKGKTLAAEANISMIWKDQLRKLIGKRSLLTGPTKATMVIVTCSTNYSGLFLWSLIAIVLLSATYYGITEGSLIVARRTYEYI